MKVLHVIEWMKFGGAQRRLFQLLKGLKGCEHIKNYLVVFSEEIDFPGLDDLNVEIIIIRSEKYISYQSFKYFKKVVETINPDIVHSWQLIASFYATVLSFRYRFTHINAMINDSKCRSFFDKERLLAKFIIPFAHVIVSNSQAGLKAYKVRRKKNVFVIYNGFDFERLNEAKTLPTDFPFGNITDGFTNVGMVARFEHAKDYPTIIKAISRLLDKGLKAKFIAVGDGTTLDFCKKLVPAEHTDSFLFLGKRSDIDSLVPFFDICVLSTFTEGISNSIMEYMAFKRPVLATDCSGNNEIIINGQTGLLVRLKDVNDWSVKLRQLIENRHIQKSLGESGYNHLNENFQLSTMVAKYKDLYKKFS